jgi:hypothetical protein
VNGSPDAAPKGQKVTIRSQEHGAVTAYVTYPRWQEALGSGATAQSYPACPAGPSSLRRGSRHDETPAVEAGRHRLRMSG